jgi:hypothetical protein
MYAITPATSTTASDSNTVRDRDIAVSMSCID